MEKTKWLWSKTKTLAQVREEIALLPWRVMEVTTGQVWVNGEPYNVCWCGPVFKNEESFIAAFRHHLSNVKRVDECL